MCSHAERGNKVEAGSTMVFTLSSTAPLPCYLVRRDAEGRVTASVEAITQDDLPAGDVLIRVAYSSLNYKDALACQGHPGVVRSFPHVPGIDCAGTVVESANRRISTRRRSARHRLRIGRRPLGRFC